MAREAVTVVGTGCMRRSRDAYGELSLELDVQTGPDHWSMPYQLPYRLV